jgi:hypothetical protein
MLILSVLISASQPAAPPESTAQPVTPVAPAAVPTIVAPSGPDLVRVGSGLVGVVLRLDLNEGGRVQTATVTRTIAMAPGMEGRGGVWLPEPFLRAVAARLSGLSFSPVPAGRQLYRFFVYDPTQPARADLGPDPTKQTE